MTIDDEILGAVRDAVGAATGEPPGPLRARPVGGGCINEAAEVTDGSGRYFVKLNAAGALPMFESERDGLEAIAAGGAVRCPRALCCGTTGARAFLVLEWLDLVGRGAESDARLGAGLAELHRTTSPDGRFGWHRDNTIGTTPQPNPWTTSWPEFFAQHRLGFQLGLAAGRGHRFRGADELVARVPEFFAEADEPKPSLLHGDLWGGNAAADSTGAPVVFDPACYFGDREADLAFTGMFGGFGPAFYHAYHAAWPPDAGSEKRRDLYNLYHVLNHDHLFGGSYATQAQRMIDGLLADAIG